MAIEKKSSFHNLQGKHKDVLRQWQLLSNNLIVIPPLNACKLPELPFSAVPNIDRRDRYLKKKR
jgi:hypothetical protein